MSRSRWSWATAPRWTEDLAGEAVAALMASGLGVAEFAQREGVCPHRLARWRRRLNEGGQREPGPAFVELVREGAGIGGDGWWFEVLVAGGRSVRVRGDFEARALRRLLAVLEEPGC